MNTNTDWLPGEEPRPASLGRAAALLAGFAIASYALAVFATGLPFQAKSPLYVWPADGLTLNADVVIGRLNKGTREETTVQLEMIGRLLQFFRQMDAGMATDDHARMIENAFLTEDFGLSVMTGEKK